MMAPPEPKNGKIPVALYTFGGIILTLAFSAIAFVLSVILEPFTLIRVILLTFCAIGAYYILQDASFILLGVILKAEANPFVRNRDPKATKTYYNAMKIMEGIALGISLRDMPEAWFQIPNDADLKTTESLMVCGFSCDRLMDERRYDEAYALYSHYDSIGSEMTVASRVEFICGRAEAKMLTGNYSEAAEIMRQLLNYRQMKGFTMTSTVLSTDYMAALLLENDPAKAENIMRQFEKREINCPYCMRFNLDRELMQTAWNRYYGKQ